MRTDVIIDFLCKNGNYWATLDPMAEKQKRGAPKARKPEDELIEAHEKFMNTVLGTPESDRAGEELLRVVFQGGRHAPAPDRRK